MKEIINQIPKKGFKEPVALFPRVTWGKYKEEHKRVNEMPEDYLMWLSTNFSCPYIRASAIAAMRGDNAPDPYNFIFLSLIETEKGNKIGITAPFILKTYIKDLPDRKWEPTLKLWSIPLFSYSDVMDTFPEAITSDKLIHELNIDTSHQTVLSDLQFLVDYPIKTCLPLYPYQRVGLQFLIENNGNALLSLEQGLGKTIIGLEYMLKGNLPALVVCPKIVIGVWVDEINDKYPDLSYTILKTRTPYPIEPVDITLINYELLDGWQHDLTDFKLVVYDESHYLQSKDSKRTKAATFISRTCQSLLMTGTPIMTHVKDLYAQLRIIAPTTFGDYYGFTARYCNGHKNEELDFWDASGSSNLEELNSRLLSSCMFRKLKKDVLKDLPPKIPSVIHVENPNPQQYNRIDVKEITGLTEALMWVSRHKIKPTIAFLTDLLDRVESVVYFTTHTDNLRSVADHFKVPYIDGSITQDSRERIISRFKTKGVNLLPMNIKSGGIGINLQSVCSTVVIGESSWSPSVNNQAIDRVHRINQKHVVNCYYIVMKDSIDTHIERQVIIKGKTIKSTVELRDYINTPSPGVLPVIV